MGMGYRCTDGDSVNRVGIGAWIGTARGSVTW
jgi:hypothetical protein